MKVLVTGSSGSLGKVLINSLKILDFDYLGITKSSKTSGKQTRCNIKKIEQISSVINNYKPDVIIHLAGLTGNEECEKDSKEAFESNVLGTLNILEASRKIKPKIIFASSREVYGNVLHKAKESSTLDPINVNGITKMLSEKLIFTYHDLYKIPFVILRFTNFYGEQSSKRGISLMIKNAIEGKNIPIIGGDQTLDLLYYNDAVYAILKSINYRQSDVFNIGSGENMTLLCIIKKLEFLSKKKIFYEKKPHKKFIVRKFSADITKAKKELHYIPMHTFNDVIERMIRKWI